MFECFSHQASNLPTHHSHSRPGAPRCPPDRCRCPPPGTRRRTFPRTVWWPRRPCCCDTRSPGWWGGKWSAASEKILKKTTVKAGDRVLECWQHLAMPGVAVWWKGLQRFFFSITHNQSHYMYSYSPCFYVSYFGFPVVARFCDKEPLKF